MAVYREGYSAVKDIQNQSRQIWPDACDYGAPTKIGDRLWNTVKQAIDWYGIKSTRTSKMKGHVTAVISLMDEWAVSDGRKTDEEATEYFKIDYYAIKRIPGGYDGFFEIVKITDSQTKKQLAAAEQSQMAA